MKQNITISQIKELSKKGKENLHEWWIGHQHIGKIYSIYDPKDKDTSSPYGYALNTCLMINDTENCAMIYLKEDDGVGFSYPQHENWSCLPLLTIGQMIEFLVSQGKNFSMAYDRNPDLWTFISGKWWQNEKGETKEGQDYPELCDALWDTCKEVLNENIIHTS